MARLLAGRLNGVIRYIRKNWGAPFVILFIVLLLLAAAESSAGSAAAANELSVYAFYSLVMGIVLQIASYVKFGEEKEMPTQRPVVGPPRPPIFSQRTKKLLGILAVVIVAVAIGAVAYDYRATHGFNALNVTVNSVDIINEPGGVVVVTLAVSASGGTPPYAFTAHWSDGVLQNSTTGAFSRTFTNQSTPASVSITVASSDGQTVTRATSITQTATSTTSSSSASSSGISTSTSSSSTSPTSTSQTTTSSATSSNPSQPRIVSNFTTQYSEPDGNVTVLIGVSVTGGTSPYNFIATWSDGDVQTGTTGTFTRTFGPTENIPTSALITVISGNGLTSSVNITISSGGSSSG